MAPPSRLRFTFTNHPDKLRSSPSNEERKSAWFQQEGTKPSYLIQVRPSSSPSSSTMEDDCSCPCKDQSAHALIDCRADDGEGQVSEVAPSSGSLLFRYGGMELVTNARNVEVYTTDEGGKEKYVFTSRGIRHRTDDDRDSLPGTEWYKFVIVNPGGAKTVMGVRMKMLSVKPSGCDVVRVLLLKVKCKLPEVEVTAGPEAKNIITVPPGAMGSSGIGRTPQEKMAVSGGIDAPLPFAGSGRSSFLGDSDPTGDANIGAALAAVTMMVRSTEERVVKAMSEGLRSLDASMSARLKRLEMHVQTVSAVMGHQNEKANEQRRVIDEQKIMIETQRAMMEKIVENQMKLLQSIEEMKPAKTKARLMKDDGLVESVTEESRDVVRHRKEKQGKEGVDSASQESIINKSSTIAALGEKSIGPEIIEDKHISMCPSPLPKVEKAQKKLSPESKLIFSGKGEKGKETIIDNQGLSHPAKDAKVELAQSGVDRRRHDISLTSNISERSADKTIGLSNTSSSDSITESTQEGEVELTQSGVDGRCHGISLTSNISEVSADRTFGLSNTSSSDSITESTQKGKGVKEQKCVMNSSKERASIDAAPESPTGDWVKVVKNDNKNSNNMGADGCCTEKVENSNALSHKGRENMPADEADRTTENRVHQKVAEIDLNTFDYEENSCRNEKQGSK